MNHPRRVRRFASSTATRRQRRPVFESLEDRRLLTSDWQNRFDVLDVDDDGSLAPIDALIGIVEFNQNGSRRLPLPATVPPYIDTDGDGIHAPVDILRVINRLNFPAQNVLTTNENRDPMLDAPADPNDIGGSVFLHNGAARLSEVDLSIPGRGDLNWELKRSYRSDVSFEGPLGHNWELNYNQRLRKVVPSNLLDVQRNFPDAQTGDVVHLSSDNRADLYASNGDGTFRPPRGFYTHLMENPDGSFLERDPEGLKITYEPQADGFARMTEMMDRNGNTMTFHYFRTFLTQVIDPLGRQIDYFYSAGNINQVRDFTGRIVEYVYDDNGDLSEVILPAVTGTPNGNDFPDGKTWRYEYDSHRLTTITAPNEVAAGGSPRVIYAYDEDPASPSFGRVIAKTVGGTNESQVPAGGTIRYQYDDLGATPDINDFGTVVRRTDVTDRNGNLTRYEFNQLNNIVEIREATNRNVRNTDPDEYVTRYQYDGDYRLNRVTYPEGNTVDYFYDELNLQRHQQGNVIERRESPGARSGDQTQIVERFRYEPVYNQLFERIDPRGNDVDFVPPLPGQIASPQRYTRRSVFDYQEDGSLTDIANELNLDEATLNQLLDDAGIQLGLGDVNGDGVTNQNRGNTIQSIDPTVQLLPGSNQAIVEGTDSQPIETTYHYNEFGQLVVTIDPEGNVTESLFFPESDPDGDGSATPAPLDGRILDGLTGGYLAETARDTLANPLRNSQTDPTPANVINQFSYDAVGNITRTVDGRGIATDFIVNQLNQVVQQVRAADHDVFAPDVTEPLPLTDFGYIERTFYDANNNIVLRQVEDRGNTSSVDGNLPAQDLPAVAPDPDPAGGSAFADQRFRYDILDNQIETVREVFNGDESLFLRTRYRYDPNQNRVLTIQPAGNASATIYDERDQLFQQIEGAFSPTSDALLGPTDPTDYDVRGGLECICATYTYDGNGNVVETVDGDDTDLSAGNSSAVGPGDRTRYIYDGFDRLTSVVDSVGNQSVFQYDPAGNVIRRLQFGSSGDFSSTSDGGPLDFPVSIDEIIQSANLVDPNLLAATESRHDELNRVFQTDNVLFVNTIVLERAADVADGASDLGKGDLTPGDNQAIPGVIGINILGRVSSQTDHDRNSRPTFTREDDGDVTQTLYDGINRRITTIDPAGNRIDLAYDGNNNIIETRETDVSQIAGIPDETFLTTSMFDSLNRLDQRTDNLGQTNYYRYDSRNNLVSTADANGPLTGSTISRRVFADGPLTVNNINDFGNVRSYFYDGINRKFVEIAALTPNGQGDGLRIGASQEGVTGDDAFPESFLPAVDVNQGGDDGFIAIGYLHDENSLLSSRIDDNGNVTLYLYDNLNRRVSETHGLTHESSMTYADIFDARVITTPTAATIDNPLTIDPALVDNQLFIANLQIQDLGAAFSVLADRIDDSPPTSIIYGYDPDGNVLIQEDENDTEVFHAYDAINRLTATRVFRAGQNDSHVGDPFFAPDPAADPNHSTQPQTAVGTTRQNYLYDGLSRLVSSHDDNDPANATDDSIVSYAYDSLGRVIEETQEYGGGALQVISSAWRGKDLRSTLTYPNGRVVEYTYDNLDRVQTVSDAGAPLPIADYDYIGTNRVLQRAFPQNGTRLTYLDDSGTANVGYDGLRRPIQMRHLRNDNSLVVGFTYTYDQANNRLTEEKLHDPANSEVYGYDSLYRLVSFDRPNDGAVPPLQTDFTLDGVGNRKVVDLEANTHSSNNELISTSIIGDIFGGGITFEYDDNGNQLTNGGLSYQYDYQNRLRTIERDFDGQIIATYTYDAAGRRSEKTVTAGTNLDGTTRFYWDGRREIEERDENDNLIRQYVNQSRLIVDLDIDGDGSATSAGDARVFLHENVLGSIFAETTGPVATIIEGFQYHATGAPTVYGPGGNGVVDFGGDDTITHVGIGQVQPFAFHGQRLDGESGLYQSGRYRDIFTGRFLTRDSLGIWGDACNIGNGYTFVGNNPINRIDPTGNKTFTFSHLLELSGDTLTPTNTFDAQFSIAFVADQASITSPSQRTAVDLFLFGEETGSRVHSDTNQTSCASSSCPLGHEVLGDTFDVTDNNLSIAPPKRKLAVDQLVLATNSIASGIFLGYVVVVVNGDTDLVNLTSVVVNARTEPADLSVFVFEPQRIEATVS